MAMLRQDESYELIGSSVIATTLKAVLVLHDDVERWIPRSVCVDGDDLDIDDTDISVCAWWAEQEGIL